MHEALEDALDRLAVLCGLSVPDRGPRDLRLAVRRLASRIPPVRENAAGTLVSRPHQAKPILQTTARFSHNKRQAVAACIALYDIDKPTATLLMQQLAVNHQLHEAAYRTLMRTAIQHVVGGDHYIHEAREALKWLERKPENFKAISLFTHALDVLMLLNETADVDLCRAAMFVRYVGGENLSLIRSEATGESGVRTEHICQVRLAAGIWLSRRCRPNIALSVMLEALQHPNPAVQLTAIYGLRHLNDDRAISPLTALALQSSCAVRKDAEALAHRLANRPPDEFMLLRSSHVNDISSKNLMCLHIPADHHVLSGGSDGYSDHKRPSPIREATLKK